METEESRPEVPETRFESFEDFWPFYLGEHRHPLNRRLHVVGTTLSLTVLVVLGLSDFWYLMGFALLIGYGFAWVGHFFIEKNRPASFSYPLYSFIGDLKMWGLACTGRLAREVACYSSHEPRKPSEPEPSHEELQSGQIGEFSRNSGDGNRHHRDAPEASTDRQD